MKLSCAFLLLAATIVVASADEEKGRNFPVMEPSGQGKVRSTAGYRKLLSCGDEYICDWESELEPKYAVCTTAGETQCLDAATVTGLSGGSCGCCNIDDEFFCANLPLLAPICYSAVYGCAPY